MLRKALARFIKWNPIAVVCVARQRIRRKLNAILHTFRLRFVYRAALWRSFGDSPPTTHRSAITLPIYRKLTDLISRRNKIDDQTTHLSIRTGDRRRSSFVDRPVCPCRCTTLRFPGTDETKVDEVSANISRYSVEERWTGISRRYGAQLKHNYRHTPVHRPPTDRGRTTLSK